MKYNVVICSVSHKVASVSVIWNSYIGMQICLEASWSFAIWVVRYDEFYSWYGCKVRCLVSPTLFNPRSCFHYHLEAPSDHFQKLNWCTHLQNSGNLKCCPHARQERSNIEKILHVMGQSWVTIVTLNYFNSKEGHCHGLGF